MLMRVPRADRSRLLYSFDLHYCTNLRCPLQVHTAASAIQAALALNADGPVCINENGDNTGCGAPGDSTHLLRALLDAELDAGVACFGWMYDPEVLQQCFDAGVGAKIDVVLGGKLEVEQGLTAAD